MQSCAAAGPAFSASNTPAGPCLRPNSKVLYYRYKRLDSNGTYVSLEQWHIASNVLLTFCPCQTNEKNHGQNWPPYLQPALLLLYQPLD